MDAQRALLDELMGTARNLTAEERKGYREINWDDKEVCGFYMVRFCPHDLFVNTRSDLGVCPKIHDPKLKESFENSPRHDSYVPKFEAELAHFCERLVSDLDRRVRRGRERLEQDVEIPPPPPISAEKSEQLSILEEKIKNLLEQVEFLGEEGKVDEAEALMRKVEILNIEKTVLTQQPQQDKLLLAAQEKKWLYVKYVVPFWWQMMPQRELSHMLLVSSIWATAWFVTFWLSIRKPRRRQEKRKDWQGRKKLKNGGRNERENMRADIKMTRLTGIGAETGRRIDYENGIVIMRNLVKETAEEAGMGEEYPILSPIVRGLEGKEVEIDIETVTEAGLVPPSGMVTGGHPGVLFAPVKRSYGNFLNLKAEELY